MTSMKMNKGEAKLMTFLATRVLALAAVWTRLSKRESALRHLTILEQAALTIRKTSESETKRRMWAQVKVVAAGMTHAALSSE